MPPVEDVAVHDKVKIGLDFRYGCHSSRNPKKSSGYYALTRRYRGNGTFRNESTYQTARFIYSYQKSSTLTQPSAVALRYGIRTLLVNVASLSAILSIVISAWRLGKKRPPLRRPNHYTRREAMNG